MSKNGEQVKMLKEEIKQGKDSLDRIQEQTEI